MFNVDPVTQAEWRLSGECLRCGGSGHITTENMSISSAEQRHGVRNWIATRNYKNDTVTFYCWVCNKVRELQAGRSEWTN